MNWYCVLTDIVIPLISALFGGFLTLLGVKMTITAQNKKEDIARKASVRPWIFTCEEHVPGDKKTYAMEAEPNHNERGFIAGNIRNTDNGLLILDYVESRTVQYVPTGDKVVDKNSSIELVIFLKDKVETLEGFHLYIRDIYDNRYRYSLIMEGNRFKLGECREL